MDTPSYLKTCFVWLRENYLRREDGAIVIEAVIVIPIVFWAWLSMFAIHDAFRMYSVHQKAAYTIGDAISRETAAIDDAYFDGTRDLFEYLAHSQGNTSMRISQIWFNGATSLYETDWSEVRGAASPLSNGEVATWQSKLPVIPANERLVLLETWSSYDPPFETGLTNDEIRTFVFTRPRYAPRVCYNTCN